MIQRPLLEKDAPGLTNSLRKLLSISAVEQLFCEYEHLFGANSPERKNIVRTPDASFNPRPARIAEIVIKDGGLSDFKSIQLALWVCAEESVMSSLNQNEATVNEALIIQKGVLGLLGANVRLRTVYSALMLDDIRHLHMVDVPQQDKVHALTEVRRVLELLPREGLSESLVAKVEHALRLQARRSGEGEEIL